MKRLAYKSTEVMSAALNTLSDAGISNFADTLSQSHPLQAALLVLQMASFLPDEEERRFRQYLADRLDREPEVKGPTPMEYFLEEVEEMDAEEFTVLARHMHKVAFETAGHSKDPAWGKAALALDLAAQELDSRRGN